MEQLTKKRLGYVFSFALNYLILLFLSKTCVLFVTNTWVYWFTSFFAFIYWFGHKLFPLLFFTLYFQITMFKLAKLEKALNITSWVLIMLTPVFLSYLSIGFFQNIPFKTFTGLNWSYVAGVEWTLAVLISFTLFHRKLRKPFTAFTVAFLSMCFAGLIYELPVLIGMPYRSDFWHVINPLIISTKWATPFMLGFTLYNLKWKPNKLFWIALAFWILFSIAYFLLPGIWLTWIPRIPTIFLMLTIPLKLKRKVEK